MLTYEDIQTHVGHEIVAHANDNGATIHCLTCSLNLVYVDSPESERINHESAILWRRMSEGRYEE